MIIFGLFSFAERFFDKIVDIAERTENEPEIERLERRWAERLAALDAYVAAKNDGSDRSRDRNDVYLACRNLAASETGGMETCSSPVGTGKTNAVMARLLQIAGRINRHFEWLESGVVVSFTLHDEDGLRLHPGFRISQQILNDLPF